MLSHHFAFCPSRRAPSSSRTGMSEIALEPMDIKWSEIATCDSTYSYTSKLRLQLSTSHAAVRWPFTWTLLGSPIWSSLSAATCASPSLPPSHVQGLSSMVAVYSSLMTSPAARLLLRFDRIASPRKSLCAFETLSAVPSSNRKLGPVIGWTRGTKEPSGTWPFASRVWRSPAR